MAFDYARAQATAARLIANFGATASLIKVTSSGDEFAPTRTEAAPVAITVVDLEREQRDATGTLVGESVRTLYMSVVAGVVPEKGDKVVVKTVEHEIDSVATLAPASTDVLYMIELVS